MIMRKTQSERRLCTCCMEKHEVKTVYILERTYFKNTSVAHDATYFYCDLTGELYTDEHQICENDITMKDAYRKTQGLLTSREIMAIRKSYCISQSDLSTLLGWDSKTIARYESHQVQDKSHDMILRKLVQNPEWFMKLLSQSEKEII